MEIMSMSMATGLDDRSINTGALNIHDKGKMEAWHQKKGFLYFWKRFFWF